MCVICFVLLHQHTFADLFKINILRGLQPPSRYFFKECKNSRTEISQQGGPKFMLHKMKT